LPEAQPKLTSQHIGNQNASRDQNGDLACSILPGDRRLVHVKFSVVSGMFASNMRDPRRRLPAQGQESKQDDPQEEARNRGRPWPERDDRDPCVGILFEEEDWEAQDQAVKKGFHNLII